MQAFSFNQAISEHPNKNLVWEKAKYARLKLKNKALKKEYELEAQSILDLIEVSVKSNLMMNENLEKWGRLAMLGQLTDQRRDLHEAIAALCLYSEQTLKMMPYKVQIMSVLAMLDENLVQLAPGEGKTLTIALVATIFAWSGKPCHVITSNDYLAERDAEIMRPLYEVAGVAASFINAETDVLEKRKRYRTPIVYATAKQLLADYLKDYIEFGTEVSRIGLSLRALNQKGSQLVMRGLHTAIVDEADSILVDDATTPLIISAPQKNVLLVEAVTIAKKIVDVLEEGVDYTLNRFQREVEYSDSGEQKILERMHLLPVMWHSLDRLEELLFQAILARDVFKVDQHYVVANGEVVIVDESTGRMMPGRTWSYGLHQAIEVQAGVELTDPSKTMARMSFQYFFKSYHRLCGASGTLQGIGFELFYNYGVMTLNMPTRLISQLSTDLYIPFLSREKKWEALIKHIEFLHVKGRPILIGTRCIEDSEELARRLSEKKMNFNLLNARYHKEEAEVIAKAGEYGSVTVATNMAGRGTDIKLDQDALKVGGLVVLMVEPHESARIDWQLFGRAGRQGQIGQAIALVSYEDKLIQDHLPWWLKWIESVPNIFMNKKVSSFCVKTSQNRAEKKSFKRRKKVVRFVQDNRSRLSFVKGNG